MKLEIFKGDITVMRVDAIVNAANKTLLGGGGVDGAIHRVAGPQLKEECEQIRKVYPDGLPTGMAVLTKAYDLPCKFVIHTVGPIYGVDDIKTLEQCYRNCFKLAIENKCGSIAFPAISTGAYKVPLDTSAYTIKRVLDDLNPDMKIVLVLYDDEAYNTYLKVFNP